MKKIVAVLVLALVAMTAVFAAEDSLVIKLTTTAKTSAGFTAQSVVNDTATSIANTVADKTVRTGEELAFFASFISTHNGDVKFKVTIPSEMTSSASNSKIKLSYKESTAKTDGTSIVVEETVSKTGTIIRYSKPITVTIGDDSEAVAGDYTATFQLEVTPN